MALTERENWIMGQILAGNVPDFLRQMVPVVISQKINNVPHSVTFYVTPDYLAVGNDADYFLTPMTPLAAQRICDAIGGTLPTARMENYVWTNAAVKFAPAPIAPSAQMTTVPVFVQHNSMVRSQRQGTTNAFPLGSLVSGDKKDIIISARIYTNFANAGITHPVVIYGWHNLDGSVIQPNYNGHEETYADYSHGARLVQNAVVLDGGPSRVTAILTNPAISQLLSNEGPSQGTSTNGEISLPRYTVSLLSPAFLVQPRSQTTWPSSNVIFEPLVAGSPPFTWAWSHDGILIPDATNSVLALSNVQTAVAGTYTVATLNSAGGATSRPALLNIISNQHPVLYADNFDKDTSAGWRLFWGSANAIPDYSVDWAYDYSAVPFTFNGITSVIPLAPGSPPGVSRAIRLSVNGNDSTAATAAVNIYPLSPALTGNFAVKCDVWVNYPGNVGGINATGSTQHAIFGLNHSGTEANWATTAAPSSDGLWFGMDGEGGESKDYRAYAGNAAGPPIDLLASGGSGMSASNNTALLFSGLFPNTRFETTGAPGKNWVQLELRQTNGTVSWLLDDTIIAQRVNTSAFVSGHPMLGLMDVFPSIANPAADSFVLFDNFRVEDLGPGVRFIEVKTLPDGYIQLTASAVPGQRYSLLESSNLKDWSVVESRTAAIGPLVFVEPATGQAKFFRLRTDPP
jgi:hypothetical protein